MNMQAMENPQWYFYAIFRNFSIVSSCVKKTPLLVHSENAIPYFLVKNEPKSYQFHQNHPHLWIMYDLQGAILPKILVVLKKI